MSRASPLPRSGDRSKAVMVGVIGGVMVISLLLNVSVSGRIRNFTAHLLDVREGPKSTLLNTFFLLVLEDWTKRCSERNYSSKRSASTPVRLPNCRRSWPAGQGREYALAARCPAKVGLPVPERVFLNPSSPAR